tara:strand:- start:3388 stop:3843 length:456 start_codon:yes stop_codon:yes gene_type:complete
MTAKNNLTQDIIIIFLITAFWDVILRLFSEKKLKFFGLENMKWITVLSEYFEKHTVLSAALIAGFVGALTHYIIIKSLNFLNLSGVNIYTFAIVVFISGILGIPMRYSGIFPHLKTHYYDPLGFTYSFATDAFSGVVVGATYQVIKQINLI